MNYYYYYYIIILIIIISRISPFYASLGMKDYAKALLHLVVDPEDFWSPNKIVYNQIFPDINDHFGHFRSFVQAKFLYVQLG